MKRTYIKPIISAEIIKLEIGITQSSNTSITVGGNESSNPLTPTTESWIDNEIDHDFFDL